MNRIYDDKMCGYIRTSIFNNSVQSSFYDLIPGFNCQKNRCKILKYTRVASHDFTQILTAHLLLGILQ